MDKLTELVDAVERRTLSIDRDRTEEDSLAAEITAVVVALRRLVTVCDGLGWQRHEGDALEEAHAALSAYDDYPDDEGGLDPFVGPDGRLSPGGDE